MQDFDLALDAVLAGWCLTYPTETFFALGGNGLDAKVARRVATIKNREKDKPLPLVIGSVEQLSLVTDWDNPVLARLTSAFWPGALSVLVPARPGLPAEVQDRRGLTSVRVTPHPVAAELCLQAGTPLIATSANLSGQPPVFDFDALSPDVTSCVDFMLRGDESPAGGLASTVVGIEPDGALRVYRQGAVSLEALVQAGFETVPA